MGGSDPASWAAVVLVIVFQFDSIVIIAYILLVLILLFEVVSVK